MTCDVVHSLAQIAEAEQVDQTPLRFLDQLDLVLVDARFGRRQPGNEQSGAQERSGIADESDIAAQEIWRTFSCMLLTVGFSPLNACPHGDHSLA